MALVSEHLCNQIVVFVTLLPKFVPYKYANSGTFLVKVNLETGDMTKKILFDYSSGKKMISTDTDFRKTSTFNTFMRHGMLNCSISKINLNK